MILLLSGYLVKKILYIWAFLPLAVCQGDGSKSEPLDVPEQVSRNGTLTTTLLKAGWAHYLSSHLPLVAKLFISLQIDASEELSCSHNFKEWVLFEERFEENDKNDKRTG